MKAGLTPSMVLVLRHLRDGRSAFSGCVTRADYGGRGGVLAALCRRGYVDRRKVKLLTDAGVAVIDAYDLHEAYS